MRYLVALEIKNWVSFSEKCNIAKGRDFVLCYFYSIKISFLLLERFGSIDKFAHIIGSEMLPRQSVVLCA